MDDSLPRKMLRAGLGRLPALTGTTAAIQRVLKEALPALKDPSLLSKFDLLSPGRRSSDAREADAPGTFLSGSFTDPAGSRPYRLYVPARTVARPPLIVMLHGCTQTAEDFAAGTRMNSLAETVGALVLYPVQVAGANAQRCWNWFNGADQQAGHGEPAIIAGMTRMVLAEHGADPARIFVAGLSAGGATAAIMGSAYPTLYAAIGVHSGLACGAASDMMSAFAAMRQARAGQGRIGVPTIIFHGDRDTTVAPGNADAVADQAAFPGASRTEQGKAPGGLAYTRTLRTDAKGRAAVEQWTVHGAGHAWSGGSSAGTYTEPRGPDASREMLRFFMEAAARR